MSLDKGIQGEKKLLQSMSGPVGLPTGGGRIKFKGDMSRG